MARRLQNCPSERTTDSCPREAGAACVMPPPVPQGLYGTQPAACELAHTGLPSGPVTTCIAFAKFVFEKLPLPKLEYSVRPSWK